MIQTPHSRRAFVLPPRRGPAGTANPQASSSQSHPTTTTVCRRLICHKAPCCRVLMAISMVPMCCRPNVAGDEGVREFLIATANLFACMLGVHGEKHPPVKNDPHHRWMAEYRGEDWIKSATSKLAPRPATLGCPNVRLLCNGHDPHQHILCVSGGQGRGASGCCQRVCQVPPPTT